MARAHIYFRLLPTLLVGQLTFASAADGDAIDFNRDIRPILSQNCFACHGPDSHERKGDLRLDTAAGAREALSVDDLSSSEFLHRISSDDPDERMPPPKTDKRLQPSDVELLGNWVKAGAP